MKIRVTEDDIILGRRNSCRRCPVARAGQRATAGLVTVSIINIDGLYLFRRRPSALGATMRDTPLPPDAAKFVHDFDEGLDVSPFEFDLTFEED